MKKIVISELSPEALAQVVTETPVIEPVVKETVIEPAAVVVDPTIQLSEEITQLKSQIEGHAEVLAAKDAEYAALKASAEGVKGIVVSQISKMRTAMSLAQVDMSTLDLYAVLVEYSAAAESFTKSFPVGGVVTKAEEKVAEKIIATSLDESAYKSVGF
jgi:pyrimidine deaminase RibD-like protein